MTTQPSAETIALGKLPEWNLDDLYKSPDAPELKRDLEHGAKLALELKSKFQGRLAGIGRDGAALAQAVADYEALSDLLGKVGSYSGLYYVGDQADPKRAKFSQDIGEQLTKISTDLIFFELELNQISEPDLAEAMTHQDLARYKPWFDDLRKEKPHQLDEKLETLFTEKSQTGRGAWNRLFNETMTDLRFDVEGEPAPADA